MPCLKRRLSDSPSPLAVEYAQSGVRVNAICPGYVRTPMAENIARQSNPDDPESVLTEMAKAIPMRRLGLSARSG
ncbi:short chain dehydrogenase [Citrobacter koseri]|uniref:Short chain dehydrogenase n=1 Tax=Citrobacter koseri TaxID=545 RepID=A0A2X2VT54_CITKO|nr:short chain dehydrogenase [Citrobacter koseri]